MSRRAHFDRLTAAARLPWSPRLARLLLLTGQSRLDDSALSPAQLALLDAVSVTAPGVEVVRTGFPFDAVCGPYAEPQLVAASIRNARQYLWTRTRARYRRLTAGVLQRALDSVQDGLVIVTGSCGLAMLSSAWSLLRRPESVQLEVVSLGPAGALPPGGPGVRFTTVQGRRDGWSRLLYGGAVSQRPDCGHLDYWSDPEARAAVAQAATRSLAADIR